ncbi:hypothetical protein ABKW28_11645 [Nocardioides sp. 31GB23]|uniref:hypothetical protein n=1 Tax=Nocardioides sp. 31GB23 TaxID=3156065 RepID=UPI0032B00C05
MFTATDGDQIPYLEDGRWLLPPPRQYRHWRHGISQKEVPIGDWPWPDADEEAMRAASSEDWLYLGWAPRPRTRGARFRHDVGHGIVMGYPVGSVLVFALRQAIGWWPR